ncbi:MAG: hypothetical protein DRI57_17580 [Deltaproteobacteria bacterium]|nr:MAG: hypothetical protein DRI57_17580 [Deltaproteobacteria bacterium]
MRVNFRQQEIIEEFVKGLEKKFPEVKFMELSESPEDPDDLWVNVTRPASDHRMIELLEYCGGKSTDILLDYGYGILVMPVVSEPQMHAG